MTKQAPPKWIDALRRLDACPEAVKWAEQFPTLQAAWDACERGDWMLWLLGRRAGGQPVAPEVRAAVWNAAGADPEGAALRDCAAIVRLHYPMAPRAATEEEETV